MIFSSHINSNLLWKRAVPQSAIKKIILYRLQLPSILLMCAFVPFFIIPRVLTVTGTAIVLRHLISLLASFFSFSFFFLFSFLFFLPHLFSFFFFFLFSFFFFFFLFSFSSFSFFLTF